MPNWCATEYTFTGNREEITDLYEKLNSLKEAKESSIKNDFGTTFLGNVVHLFGGDYQEIYCRGYFHYIDLHLNYISLSTETAWREMNEVWEFVRSKYKTIRYYYYAEEQGCDYYVTNDVEGNYFPTRFIIMSPGKETIYTNTLKEVLEKVSEQIEKTLTSKEELLQAIEIFNNTCGEDECIYFNEIEVVKPEET